MYHYRHHYYYCYCYYYFLFVWNTDYYEVLQTVNIKNDGDIKIDNIGLRGRVIFVLATHV